MLEPLVRSVGKNLWVMTGLQDTTGRCGHLYSLIPQGHRSSVVHTCRYNFLGYHRSICAQESPPCKACLRRYLKSANRSKGDSLLYECDILISYLLEHITSQPLASDDTVDIHSMNSFAQRVTGTVHFSRFRVVLLDGKPSCLHRPPADR